MSMSKENFTAGEYVKKEDVMNYLRIFNWDMPRQDLIERFKEMPTVTLSEQDVNKIIINKILNGEF